MTKKEIIIQTDTGLRRSGEIRKYDMVDMPIERCGFDISEAIVFIDGQYVSPSKYNTPIECIVDMTTHTPVRVVINYKEHPYLHQDKIVAKDIFEVKNIMRIHHQAGIAYLMRYECVEQKEIWTFEHETRTE